MAEQFFISEGSGYEFLDHTADVQFHCWGTSLKQAFEATIYAMFDYITELSSINIVDSTEISISGHDLPSLLYNFMDEVLFTFSTEFFVAKKVTITDFDTENFSITVKLDGEEFELGRHPQGTEIKAITYSNMQIIENPGKVDIYVIVDI
eukprot:GCRY01004518.1.p1 GENE.GCRY01004518.1~~GCRY01004518.1.p1  ORF type:complete len:150 (+),score=23.46 GCRY01004518.1:201-650(+)